MKLLRTVEGVVTYPYSLMQLKLDFPNTSFPENISQQTLLEYGVHIVNYSPVPNDPLIKITEDTPEMVGDQYYEKWISSTPATEEVNNILNRQWSDIRVIRSQYLTNSDWTQLEDSPFETSKKNDWKKYRQSLRDITLQSDPFNIVWPIKPE